MKLIHTYKPITIGKIDKKLIYQLTLSALLAKRHYGNIVLYTDPETANIVRKVGIPYDEINTETLSQYNGKAYTLPKMFVYAEQTEPFIHIDIDTFLFNKITVKDDKSIYCTFQEGLTDYIEYDERHMNFHNTYIKNSFELLPKLDKKFVDFINFEGIYNTCFFGGYEHKLISEATKYCLDIYNKNSQFIDSEYYNGVMIEQMLIPAAIRMICDDNGIDPRFEPIYNDKIPNTFYGIDKGKIKYPLTLQSGSDILFIRNEIDL